MDKLSVNKIIRTLLSGVSFFFLLMALFSFFLYCVGSYQELSESATLLLLKVLFFSGITLFIMTMANALAARAIKYIPVSLAGLVFALFAGIIIVFSGGNE